MAIGRISGSVLKSNLTRNGVDLAFETNLLYLDVTNSRVGIGTSEPTTTLHVNGTTTTTGLTANGAIDIDGTGTSNIDNVIIGANTPVAGTFTTLNANTSATLASGSTAGTLTLANGSITDSSGAISFGDENLNTTGTLTVSGFTFPSADGKVKPETVSVPVVVKFSSPKLIAPLESVIDPFASVRLPTVDPVASVAALVLVTLVAVTVPLTCNAVVGSEVPIPTRLFVTSRYSRFVSNARSTPFLVRLDFRTDPDIRPMAILWYSFYNNVSRAYALHGLVIIAGRQQYGYLCA